jgi:hypothetical protein
MSRIASGCLSMATDHDRLTTFFYLLTRGTDRRDGISWGHVTRVIDDCLNMEAAIANDVAEGRCLVGDPVFASNGAEALAREMARRLLGPVQRGATDSLRCAALRDAAEMLTRVRRSPGTQTEIDLESMIDRCNLAAMGVAYDGESPSTIQACRYMLADACGGALNSDSGDAHNADAWDLARYCEHIRDEQIAIVSQLGEIFGDDAEHLGQPYGDSFAAVQAALGQMRRVADDDEPAAALIANGWADLGHGWYHSEDGTAASMLQGTVRVTGGRDMTGAELRALAEFADGKTAGTDLRSVAARWLETSHEYWEAYARKHGRGAVVWVDSETGALAIYTRGEYADQLRAAIPTEGNATVHSLLPEPRDVLTGLGWRFVETETIDGKAHELWSKPSACGSLRFTVAVSPDGVEGDSDTLLSPTELRAFAAHAESL